MFWHRYVYVISIGCMVFLMVGCNSQKSGSGGQKETMISTSVEKSLDITLSSRYTGVTSKTTASKSIQAATSVLNGELQYTNYTTGSSGTIDWSAYMDESDFTLQSTKTVALEPGNYSFSLLLENSSYQYAGSAYNITIMDGNDTAVPMTLKPIIGNTVLNVSAVSTMGDFTFTYDPSQLASFTSPQLGISIDGSAEEVFAINKSTGSIDNYVNLSDGNHVIKLSLYDGGNKIGRSVSDQENVLIASGSPLTMDIIAVHAQMDFVFNTDDGNATIKANIPQDVIDLIGLSNLQVIMTLTDGNTTYEDNMGLLTEDNSTYGVSVIDTAKYGTYDLQLAFSDQNASMTIGSCLMDNVLFDRNETTLNCNIALQETTFAGGDLLATVGINVYNVNHEPVSGVTIYANGQPIGITGSGTFGTAGYIEKYMIAGAVLFQAGNSSTSGSVSSTLYPLDVSNLEIVLDHPIDPSHDFFGDGSVLLTYDFDNNTNDLGGFYDGTATMTDFVTGKNNQGILFNSGDDMVQVGSSLPSLQQYTIAFYTKLDVAQNWDYFFYLKQNNSITLIEEGGYLVFEHQKSDWTASTVTSTTAASALVGSFHHIALTADGLNIKMYIDGVLMGTTAYDGTVLAKTDKNLIGNNGNGYGLHGTIDQFRIFNRALTQTEVTQLSNEF